jgi:hypothetical protein
VKKILAAAGTTLAALAGLCAWRIWWVIRRPPTPRGESWPDYLARKHAERWPDDHKENPDG